MLNFRLKSFLLSMLFLLLPLSALTAPPDIFNRATDAIKQTSEAAELGDSKNADPVASVSHIINIAVGILGVVAVILIIYAGGLWLTAAGEDSDVKKSKDIIKSTVIGMIIIGLAYAITTFIIDLVVTDPPPPEGTGTVLAPPQDGL